MPTTTSHVGAPGTTAGFANERQWERIPVFEMREKSVFGAMAISTKGKTRGDDPGDKKIDPSKTSAVMYREFTKGSVANWSMQKRLTGGPVFGEQVPPKGPSLEFWHSELPLNLIKTPAYPIPTEFTEMKLQSTIDGPMEPRVRAAMADVTAMYFSNDHYKAALYGASDNVRASAADGGLFYDLGRGNGKQMSPLNCIARGTGVIGGATLDAREASLRSAIANLSTSDADHLITIKAIHEFNEEIASGSNKLEGIDMNGQEGFIFLLPTRVRAALGDELAQYAREATPLTERHWLLNYRPVTVGKLHIVFDDMIAKYAPDVTGSEVVWGKASTDPFSWDFKDLTAAQKTRGIGMIFGASSLRTAQAKAMRFTVENERHETGSEVSAKTYRSIVRSQWYDKQDSSVMPIDQSFMLVLFAMNGLTHGA